MLVQHGEHAHHARAGTKHTAQAVQLIGKRAVVMATRPLAISWHKISRPPPFRSWNAWVSTAMLHEDLNVCTLDLWATLAVKEWIRSVFEPEDLQNFFESFTGIEFSGNQFKYLSAVWWVRDSEPSFYSIIIGEHWRGYVLGYRVFITLILIRWLLIKFIVSQ